MARASLCTESDIPTGGILFGIEAVGIADPHHSIRSAVDQKDRRCIFAHKIDGLCQQRVWRLAHGGNRPLRSERIEISRSSKADRRAHGFFPEPLGIQR